MWPQGEIYVYTHLLSSKTFLIVGLHTPKLNIGNKMNWWVNVNINWI